MRKALHCVLGKALLCASLFLVFQVALFAEGRAQDSVFAYNHGGTTLYYVVDSTGAAKVVPPLHPGVVYTSVDSTQGETWMGYTKPRGAVVVPDSVPYQGRNYAVTKIGVRAFLNCDSITAITFPATLTEISRGGMRGCNGLETVVLPDSLSVIGETAFFNCEALRSVVMPDRIQKLGSWAFGWCYNLRKVTIPPVMET